MQEDFVPDFSGDDFADDPEIRKDRLRKQAYNDMIRECISIMKKELLVEPSGHKNLKSFLSFRELLRPFLSESFKSQSPFLPLHVSIVRYDSIINTARTRQVGSDDYLFGLLLLKRNYPKTVIIKETLREKIADILTRSEVDFPHAKKFSRKFYVLSEDRHNLSQLLSYKPLNDLTNFPNMEVEMNGNLCLFRSSRKSISVNGTIEFSELAKALNSVLN